MTRIVVVDDEAAIRALLRTMLEEAGHDVELASSGREAVHVLSERPADMVITDIVMPDMEGLELIRRLVRMFPDLAIIAISGAGRAGPVDYLQMATLLGAQRTFAKPFRLNRLMTAVEELGPVSAA